MVEKNYLKYSMEGNRDLRELLAKIVSPENAENWWKSELFEIHTRPILPQELEILAPPPQERCNYNCFIFVLGLQTHPQCMGNDAWEFMKNLGDIFDYFLKQNIFISTKNPKAGDGILYRADDASISHVGVVQNDKKIISKWSWGPLIRHSVWDVPSGYGNIIEYFQITEAGKEFIIRLRGI